MIGTKNNAESARPIAFVRYLGIDVRPRSFGFVVTENGSLLDCGVRICDRHQFDDCLGRRFLRMVRTYSPYAVIIGRPKCGAGGEKRRAILTAIKKGAKQQGINVVFISPAALRNYFRCQNATTKYEIAQIAAQILPELAWKLPRKRRAWESEHHRMSIFDAAAVLITHTSR